MKDQHGWSPSVVREYWLLAPCPLQVPQRRPANGTRMSDHGKRKVADITGLTLDHVESLNLNMNSCPCLCECDSTGARSVVTITSRLA